MGGTSPTNNLGLVIQRGGSIPGLYTNHTIGLGEEILEDTELYLLSYIVITYLRNISNRIFMFCRCLEKILLNSSVRPSTRS